MNFKDHIDINITKEQFVDLKSNYISLLTDMVEEAALQSIGQVPESFIEFCKYSSYEFIQDTQQELDYPLQLCDLNILKESLFELYSKLDTAKVSDELKVKYTDVLNLILEYEKFTTDFS